MAFQKIILRPGVNAQATSLLNEAGWSSSDLIRFKDGLLQKIGGWQRLTDDEFVGVCRCILPWADLNLVPYVAGGTDQRLEVLYSGSLYDITPLRKTDNLSGPFATVASSATITVTDIGYGGTTGDTINIITPTAIGGLVLFGYYVITDLTGNTYTITASSPATGTASGGLTALFNTTFGSSTVTVTLANHGFVVNDVYTVYVSTTVGGLTIFGPYIVQTVPTANTFTITVSGVASSTTSGRENGGNVRIEYLIPSGLPSNITGLGWGEGGWGLGPWGMGTNSGAPIPLRQWSLGAWGEQLIASPSNGAIYVWDPTGGVTNNPATIITQAPAFNTGFFIAMPERQIVSYGAQDSGTLTQDPMLVRWCDVDDYTDWIATSDNQAGSYRLPRGSTIVGGIQGPQFGMLWTDLAVWQMQYIQPPLIYGFNEIASGCGLIAQRAVGILGGIVYWMSQNGFFFYNGGAVQALPCAVWDIIFRNLDTFQKNKITCAPNSYFNEIAWHFPAADGSGENDTYVKFNPVDQTWDYGSLIRTAWTDQSIFGSPMGVDGDGLLQQHETSPNADGSALSASATSGWFKISDGTLYLFIERMIPDFVLSSGAEVKVTVEVVNYPDDTPDVYGPFSVTSATEFIIVRARGRLARVTISSNDLGSFWRLGELLYSFAPAGKR